MPEDNIFPVLDRQTPVMDKIRQRRNGSSKKSGMSIGDILEETLVGWPEDGDDEEELVNQIGDDVAKALGVPKDALRRDTVEDLVNEIARLEIDDVIQEDAMEELGLTPPTDTTDDEKEEAEAKF